MKKILIISLVFILFACEKEIQLDIANAGKKIVVQAMIQEGYPPIVQLTWSDSYFANFDSNNVMFISGAEIIIYNQDRTDSVILAEIDALIQGFPPGIYADLNINFNANPPFSNFHDFCNEGSSYHLKVIFENDTLTATTSIPNATPLDSIWFVPDDRFPEYGDFYAYYNDPDTMGNNVMFEHKRVSHFSLAEEKDIPDFMFIKAYGAVRNDFEGLNGMGFETFFERGEGPKFNHEDINFKDPNLHNFQMAYTNDTVGEVFADVVILRFSQLDKASFEFWRSVIAQDLMNSNPFAEPMNLKSNINGGLGIFEGKAAVYYKLIAKEDTTFTQRYYPDIFEIL